MRLKISRILFLIIIALTFINCNNSNEKKYSKVTDVDEQLAYTAKDHPGKKLLENNCYVCHSPKSSMSERIAPPMVAVKSHYINNDISKKDFIEAIWNFTKKPSEENAKMRGAIRRFNLMPYQKFKEEDIRLIADYMYDYKIDEPEWFKQHIEEESNGKMKYNNRGKSVGDLDSNSIITPSEIGLDYALSTKKELGKNLMGTIQKKGTLEAVAFCNKQAYPITDSMATAQNATIRRVSDKPRNPSNLANTKEIGMINNYKTIVATGKKVEPIVETKDGISHFYYPITTNTMCLQCHGNTTTHIEPLVLNKIKDLYPTDKAVNYDVNQVRGIWAITFDETNIK